MLVPLYDQNPHHRIPLVTVLLIVCNVWITWELATLPPERQLEVVLHRGFIPLRLTKIDDPRPLEIVERVPDLNPQAQRPPRVVRVQLPNDTAAVYGTFVSTMFLHGGWFHLLTNMWMLWVFGNNIEERLGHLVFALFYLAGGVVATLSHWMIDPGSTTPIIGASGAVAAVLGGYALTYPWVRVRTLIFIGLPLLVDVPAFLVLGLWMVGETIMGLLQWQMGVVAGVAHWAHIGGFLAGLVLMPLLAVGSSPEGEDWRKETDSLFQFDAPRRGPEGRQ